ncbi:MULTISPECIES: hypothetical protein [unclassified Okeania]|nr:MULTISPECIES: hypothetical protein [unclassified Okeania]
MWRPTPNPSQEANLGRSNPRRRMWGDQERFGNGACDVTFFYT